MQTNLSALSNTIMHAHSYLRMSLHAEMTCLQNIIVAMFPEL